MKLLTLHLALGSRIVGQGNGETQRLVLVGKRELHQNP